MAASVGSDDAAAQAGARLPDDAEEPIGLGHEVIPVAGSHRLAALLPHNDLHEFGRCGHWVQIEAAARFVRLVTDFLYHGL